MDPANRHILHLGQVVVVSVLMQASAILDGGEVSGPLRDTRVWCERADGWRVVAGHMSAVTG